MSELSDGTPEELERIRDACIPDRLRAEDAIRAGDVDAALTAVERMGERFASLQDYSVNWVTSLLTFIGEHLGEDAVEEALRGFGEDYLRDRRDPGDGTAWADLPADVRARALIRPMVANGATVDVAADEERITLTFRCGSGGRLVDEGRYGDGGYLVLQGDGPVTFGEPGLPVYCAHCSVNNELQPIEWVGAPITVEFPTRAPGEPCVHHVYRDGHRNRS